jgi:hypothetical protein
MWNPRKHHLTSFRDVAQTYLAGESFAGQYIPYFGKPRGHAEPVLFTPLAD